LINESHIHKVSNKILINTSRGEIISEAFLLKANSLIYISDVWVNEPNPSLEIIKKSYIATPHIAGYSIDGKLNGSTMIAKECARAFNCLQETSLSEDRLIDWPHGLKNIIRDMHGHGFPVAVFKSELDLQGLSDNFKHISSNQLADKFKSLRTNHLPRHDFNKYSYKNLVALDESINMDFFNAIQNL
jgi:erythronate-4-phosphate dehydrogenase